MSLLITKLSGRKVASALYALTTLLTASALNLNACFASSTEFRHGALDGSFTDGKLILGKTIPINGFHQGLPTLVLVDMGSHTTFVVMRKSARSGGNSM